MSTTTTPSTKQSTTARKQVTVILRCTRKANGAVIYHIANGDQQEYLVTLVKGVATGCTQMSGEPCKGCLRGRKCYHKTQCEAIESARALYIEKHGSTSGFLYRVPEKKAEAEKEAAQKIKAPGLVQSPRVDAPRKESAFKKEFDALKLHRETRKPNNQGFQLFR